MAGRWLPQDLFGHSPHNSAPQPQALLQDHERIKEQRERREKDRKDKEEKRFAELQVRQLDVAVPVSAMHLTRGILVCVLFVEQCFY